MATVEVAEKSFEVPLMLGGRFMVRFLELRVSDECTAVLAPVLGLYCILEDELCACGLDHLPSTSSIPT